MSVPERSRIPDALNNVTTGSHPAPLKCSRCSVLEGNVDRRETCKDQRAGSLPGASEMAAVPGMTGRLSTQIRRAHMLANFSLDSFRITDTRSRHEDTDYVTVSIAVGGKTPVTTTRRVGDVNNGTHNVGLGVAGDIPTTGAVPVVFSYVILNSGHGDQSQIQHGVETALSALGSKAAQAATSAVGGALG